MTAELDITKIMLDASIIVKFVLLMLVAASVVSWAIVIKKRKQIKLLRAANSKFLQIYQNASTINEVARSISDCPGSSFATMYSRAQNEVVKIADKIGQNNLAEITHYFSKNGKEAIERSLKQGMNEAGDELDSMLSILASIGSTAPFVGLFGTVWGIIESFHGLASGGGATIEAVAPGIAEALVATAVGLIVAIPAVWFFNFFNNENSRQNILMESFGQDVLNFMERTILIIKK